MRNPARNPHAFLRITLFVLAMIAACLPATFAQDVYQKPPKAVRDVFLAPASPTGRVSPSGDMLLLAEPVRYPSIADLSRPMLRLAGLRIDPGNTGPHNPPHFIHFTVVRVADGSELKIALPPSAHAGPPFWAPDGKHFAFTNTTRTAVELWVGDARTGAAKKIAGGLNAVLGPPCHWFSGSRSLLCTMVPAGRGKPPAEPQVPAGPIIEESFGRAAPVPTFEDLLTSKHDEDLFDYYTTAQLASVQVASGKVAPIGKPAIFETVEPAPNGKHILVARVHHPYSYIVTVRRFPREVDVWNAADGSIAYKLADLPLQENVPIGGVPTGPRNFHWRPTDPATLVWVEALDEGNPHKKAPHRDRILWLKAPFAGQPLEFAKTEQRFAGLAWGERGDLAILRDYDRNRQWTRAWFLNPNNPSASPRLVWDMSVQDRYHDPGQPVMRELASGASAIEQQGDSIYLEGRGASPEGDRPFLDRFDTKELKAERLFRCDDKSYEEFVALLSPDGSKFLTRHESPADPPNFFVRTAGSETPRVLTHLPDPTPQLRAIRKQLVTYKRADGVELSMTVYLPPDYHEGERRPAVLWAYPLEFTDPTVAGQVSGSPNRFTAFLYASQLYFLLDGYVVLDNASMPVVGDPRTVNDTYVDQIASSAKAAIEKAAEMGVIDPNRVGVGGHSYGAFMTANLLAHSNLFRAGIARSGAYNRTLTPFGFQNERRTFWEAPETYFKMSPFMYADKLKAPILLIHGEADNNSGTFPIQSERMYRALKGNGGSVRYVRLPAEAHGYVALETNEHVLWEMLRWFDKYVKNAPPEGATNGAAPSRH
jgi:dipeptidyl aminopeptidase/acylaminoacyl peptidase